MTRRKTARRSMTEREWLEKELGRWRDDDEIMAIYSEHIACKDDIPDGIKLHALWLVRDEVLSSRRGENVNIQENQ